MKTIKLDLTEKEANALLQAVRFLADDAHDKNQNTKEAVMENLDLKISGAIERKIR